MSTGFAIVPLDVGSNPGYTWAIEEIEWAMLVLQRRRDALDSLAGTLRGLAAETAWASPSARAFHDQAEGMRAEAARIADRFEGLRLDLDELRSLAMSGGLGGYP